MKKFMVITVVLLAFSFVSCKGVEREIRLPAPLTKAECEKDATMQWNAEANEGKGACKAKIIIKAECEKDKTKQWNAEANEGKGACEDKPKEAIYTITNKITDTSVVNNLLSIRMKSDPIGEAVDLGINECLKIKESQFAKMVVLIMVDNERLCDSLNTDQDDDCKVGNYEVVARLPVHYGPSELHLSPSLKNESEDCKDPLNLKEK